MEGRNSTVVIIGGGAAGIFAAISAGRCGASVIICERMNRLGKKILASGNGRCNLCNDSLGSTSYNPSSRSFVAAVFSRFGKNEILQFFGDLGLATYSEEGRIFPATNQSASVLKVLEMELKKLSIRIEYDFDVSHINHSANRFAITARSGKKIEATAVILACGGKTYPAFGSDGSAYAIAQHFGHTIIEPVPVAVPLLVKDPLCHALQGQKICAKTKCFVGGKTVAEASGELLFTKYGLSGTAIIDISEEASIAINRNKRNDVTLSVDMVPFFDETRLSNALSGRIGDGVSAEDIVAGLLPNKFGPALNEVLRVKDAAAIAKQLKDMRFKVSGTRGWNEADFTAGGVDVKEIDEKTLESKLEKRLYFAGEMLDVDGKRGGYNLAWAWASGHIAGEAAVHA